MFAMYHGIQYLNGFYADTFKYISLRNKIYVISLKAVLGWSQLIPALLTSLQYVNCVHIFSTPRLRTACW